MSRESAQQQAAPLVLLVVPSADTTQQSLQRSLDQANTGHNQDVSIRVLDSASQDRLEHALQHPSIRKHPFSHEGNNTDLNVSSSRPQQSAAARFGISPPTSLSGSSAHTHTSVDLGRGSMPSSGITSLSSVLSENQLLSLLSRAQSTQQASRPGTSTGWHAPQPDVEPTATNQLSAVLGALLSNDAPKPFSMPVQASGDRPDRNVSHAQPQAKRMAMSSARESMRQGDPVGGMRLIEDVARERAESHTRHTVQIPSIGSKYSNAAEPQDDRHRLLLSTIAGPSSLQRPPGQQGLTLADILQLVRERDSVKSSPMVAEDVRGSQQSTLSPTQGAGVNSPRLNPSLHNKYSSFGAQVASPRPSAFERPRASESNSATGMLYELLRRRTAPGQLGPDGPRLPTSERGSRHQPPDGSRLPTTERSSQHQHPDGARLPTTERSSYHQHPDVLRLPTMERSSQHQHPDGPRLTSTVHSPHHQHPDGSRLPITERSSYHQHPDVLRLPTTERSSQHQPQVPQVHLHDLEAAILQLQAGRPVEQQQDILRQLGKRMLELAERPAAIKTLEHGMVEKYLSDQPTSIKSLDRGAVESYLPHQSTSVKSSDRGPVESYLPQSTSIRNAWDRGTAERETYMPLTEAGDASRLLKLDPRPSTTTGMVPYGRDSPGQLISLMPERHEMHTRSEPGQPNLAAVPAFVGRSTGGGLQDMQPRGLSSSRKLSPSKNSTQAGHSNILMQIREALSQHEGGNMAAGEPATLDAGLVAQVKQLLENRRLRQQQGLSSSTSHPNLQLGLQQRSQGAYLQQPERSAAAGHGMQEAPSSIHVSVSMGATTEPPLLIVSSRAEAMRGSQTSAMLDDFKVLGSRVTSSSIQPSLLTAPGSTPHAYLEDVRWQAAGSAGDVGNESQPLGESLEGVQLRLGFAPETNVDSMDVDEPRTSKEPGSEVDIDIKSYLDERAAAGMGRPAYKETPFAATQCLRPRTLHLVPSPNAPCSQPLSVGLPNLSVSNPMQCISTAMPVSTVSIPGTEDRTSTPSGVAARSMGTDSNVKMSASMTDGCTEDSDGSKAVTVAQAGEAGVTTSQPLSAQGLSERPQASKLPSNRICEHGKVWARCKACKGVSICPHGKIRTICRDCGGGSICLHGRVRSKCKDCGGGSICQHSKVRSQCKDCRGGSICVHGKQRTYCRMCGGGSICVHGKARSKCKDCGGGSICIHSKVRSKCRDCGGGSICLHRKRRSECKVCGGGSICPHDRVRSKCKECSGVGSCVHGLQRLKCTECSSSAVVLCDHGNPRGMCSSCLLPPPASAGMGAATQPGFMCPHGLLLASCSNCTGPVTHAGEQADGAQHLQSLG